MEWLTLAIMDKGYYDYDYQYVEPPKEQKLVEDTAKSDAEIAKRLARFGIGRVSQEAEDTSQGEVPKGAEALQEAVIKDLKEREGKPTK